VRNENDAPLRKDDGMLVGKFYDHRVTVTIFSWSL